VARAARRRELSVIDDPLESRALLGEASVSATAETPRGVQSEASGHGRARFQNDQPLLAQEAVKAVFGRVPASLARRLEGAVFELRATRPSVTQQDVLAALLWRYVDHEAPEKLDELTRLLDEYAAARGDAR
jgi:hypothetical protein